MVSQIGFQFFVQLRCVTFLKAFDASDHCVDALPVRLFQLAIGPILGDHAQRLGDLLVCRRLRLCKPLQLGQQVPPFVLDPASRGRASRLAQIGNCDLVQS